MDKDQLKQYAEGLKKYVEEVEEAFNEEEIGIYSRVCRIKRKWAALKGYLEALTEINYEGN